MERGATSVIDLPAACNSEHSEDRRCPSIMVWKWPNVASSKTRILTVQYTLYNCTLLYTLYDVTVYMILCYKLCCNYVYYVITQWSCLVRLNVSCMYIQQIFYELYYVYCVSCMTSIGGRKGAIGAIGGSIRERFGAGKIGCEPGTPDEDDNGFVRASWMSSSSSSSS